MNELEDHIEGYDRHSPLVIHASTNNRVAKVMLLKNGFERHLTEGQHTKTVRDETLYTKRYGR